MKKIEYILSGPSNFDNQLGKLISKDTKDASSIVFVASSFNEYDNIDKYSKIILSWFKEIKINFKNIGIIDNRIDSVEASNLIEKADIVLLMGGDTLKQISYIKEYNLIKSLNKRTGITIGISAGAINMSEHVVLAKDESDNIPSTVCYEGIGLTNINIEPHFDFINIEHNKDIFEASTSGKITCLPNESFIRIEEGKTEYYGPYYVIEDGNLDQKPFPYENINHLGTIDLGTKRLILRRAVIEDASEMFYMQLDPELRKYMGSTKLGTNIDKDKYFFSKILENYKEANFYRWTIVRKEDELVLGTIMLNMHDEKARCAGIDYYLRKDQWNKGYMTEAAKKILAFAFEELDLYRIESCGSKNNPGTYKVMEHIGLKYEGIRKQAFFYYYGGIQDLVLYGLTKEEYEKKS